MIKLIRLAQQMFEMRKEKKNRADWTEEYCVGFVNALELLSERIQYQKSVAEVKSEIEKMFIQYCCEIKKKRKKQ